MNDATEAIVSAVTAVIDNTEPAYRWVKADARKALARYKITTAEDIRNVHRASDPYSPQVLALEVGDAVADRLRGWIAAEQLRADHPVLLTILTNLLDLSNTEVHRLLGEHYLPQPEEL